MRIALQCRDHFSKLQMRNKLVSSFRGGEGIGFQCDLGMKKKKKLFSWEKEVGGERDRGERNVSLKLNLQLSCPLLS